MKFYPYIFNLAEFDILNYVDENEKFELEVEFLLKTKGVINIIRKKHEVSISEIESALERGLQK